MPEAAKFCNGCGEKFPAPGVNAKPAGFQQVTPKPAAPTPALDPSTVNTGVLNSLNSFQIANALPIQPPPQVQASQTIPGATVPLPRMPYYIGAILYNPASGQPFTRPEADGHQHVESPLGPFCSYCGAINPHQVQLIQQMPQMPIKAQKKPLGVVLLDGIKTALEQLERSALMLASFFNVFVALFWVWTNFPRPNWWFLLLIFFGFPLLGIANKWKTDYESGPTVVYWIYSSAYQFFFFLSIVAMWYEPRFILVWFILQTGMIVYALREKENFWWFSKFNLSPHMQGFILLLVILVSWIVMLLTHLAVAFIGS